MLITNLQGESSLLNDLAQPSAISHSSDDSVGGSFYRLVSSVGSGDVAGAQRNLGRFHENADSQATGTSPFRQALSDVGAALSLGDIQAPETALSTWQSSFNQSPAPASTAQAANGGASTGSTVSEFGNKVLNLVDAIGSGDLNSAQSVYGSLSGMLPGNSSPSTYSVSPDARNASTSDFGALRSRVELALESGNVASAEAAMQSLLQGISSGSILRTSA